MLSVWMVSFLCRRRRLPLQPSIVLVHNGSLALHIDFAAAAFCSCLIACSSPKTISGVIV